MKTFFLVVLSIVSISFLDNDEDFGVELSLTSPFTELDSSIPCLVMSYFAASSGSSIIYN